MVDVLKRNNVRVKGQGDQAIMFLHGYGCDQNMWRFVAPAFEENYKVILLDLVGAGQSDLSAYSPIRHSSLKGYAKDINEVIVALGLEDVIFVGHSVSAMIGALASIERPDLFANLIMIGPSPRYINDEDYFGGFDQKDIDELMEVMDHNYLGWSSNIAPAIMGNPDRPELGEELTNSFCRTNPDIGKAFAKTTFLSDNRKDLAEVAVPSLIMQCSEDMIAPDAVGKYVHQKVANSHFVKLKATGHCPNLSAPEETIEIIKAYLTDGSNG